MSKLILRRKLRPVARIPVKKAHAKDRPERAGFPYKVEEDGFDAFIYVDYHWNWSERHATRLRKFRSIGPGDLFFIRPTGADSEWKQYIKGLGNTCTEYPITQRIPALMHIDPRSYVAVRR